MNFIVGITVAWLATSLFSLLVQLHQLWLVKQGYDADSPKHPSSPTNLKEIMRYELLTFSVFALIAAIQLNMDIWMKRDHDNQLLEPLSPAYTNVFNVLWMLHFLPGTTLGLNLLHTYTRFWISLQLPNAGDEGLLMALTRWTHVKKSHALIFVLILMAIPILLAVIYDSTILFVIFWTNIEVLVAFESIHVLYLYRRVSEQGLLKGIDATTQKKLKMPLYAIFNIFVNSTIVTIVLWVTTSRSGEASFYVFLTDDVVFRVGVLIGVPLLTLLLLHPLYVGMCVVCFEMNHEELEEPERLSKMTTQQFEKYQQEKARMEWEEEHCMCLVHHALRSSKASSSSRQVTPSEKDYVKSKTLSAISQPRIVTLTNEGSDMRTTRSTLGWYTFSSDSTQPATLDTSLAASTIEVKKK